MKNITELKECQDFPQKKIKTTDSVEIVKTTPALYYTLNTEKPFEPMPSSNLASSNGGWEPKDEAPDLQECLTNNYKSFFDEALEVLPEIKEQAGYHLREIEYLSAQVPRWNGVIFHADRNGVPLILRDDFGIKYHAVRDDFSPGFKYPKMRAAIRSGIIPDDLLLKTANRIRENAGIITTISSDGERSFFAGKKKGTKAYAAVESAKIFLKTQKLLAVVGTPFFITTTCDTKRYGNNIEAACRGFNEELKLFKKTARRFNNFRYICILEFTNKGFPHAHIICGWENYYAGTWHQPSGVCREAGTTVRNMVRHSFHNQLIDVRIAEGENVAGYLTKYVAKAFEANQIQLSEKGLLAKPNRKQLLGFVISYMLHLRTVQTSLELAEEKEIYTPENIAAFAEYGKKYAGQTRVSSAPQARALICAITNLTNGFAKEVTYTPRCASLAFYRHLNPEKTEDFEEFQKYSKLTGKNMGTTYHLFISLCNAVISNLKKKWLLTDVPELPL